eukprot:m.607571 g.607571  ORF g.607571 m.607571 type:complete len:190 (-) comp58119_c2_seq29:808-1377(-)
MPAKVLDLHDFGQHSLVEVVLECRQCHIPLQHILLLVEIESAAVVVLLQEFELALHLHIVNNFCAREQFCSNFSLCHALQPLSLQSVFLRRVLNDTTRIPFNSRSFSLIVSSSSSSSVLMTSSTSLCASIRRPISFFLNSICLRSSAATTASSCSIVTRLSLLSDRKQQRGYLDLTCCISSSASSSCLM